MQYQNYFFDFDGTLYDTYPGMVKAFVQAFENQGVSLSKSEVYQVMREESVRAAYRRYTTERMDEVRLHAEYHKFEQNFRDLARPFPQTRELLNKIVTAGGKNFLLTHRDKSSLALLARDDLLKYFVDHSTAADGFKRKPDPEALNHLIVKHELDPKKSVMIGDRSLDIQAGHNANMAGILFDPDKMITQKTTAEQIVTRLGDIS